MRHLLDRAVDGRAKGLLIWYAEAHARLCPACAPYLAANREIVARLEELRETVHPDEETLARLSRALAAAAEGGPRKGSDDVTE